MAEKKAITVTEQQQAVIDNRGGDLLVSAAAGSGKTKVLVDRIVKRVCVEGADIDRFVVITYTKAAAAELRNKIMAELSRRLAETPADKHIRAQLKQINNAQISTVHSFCANLLRQNAALIGLPSDFRVAEEQECKVLRAGAMEDLLESLYKDIEKHPDIKAFVEELGYGRDDSAVPAILYDIYETIQAHPYPQRWVEKCLADMDMSQYLSRGADASETPWGKYIIDSTKAYIRTQIRQVDDALAICDTDKALSAAYSDTLVADRTRLDSILYCTTWDELYLFQSSSWPRMGRVKKGEPYSAILQEQVKAIRDRYKKAVDAKLKNVYGNSSEVLGDLAKAEPSVRGMFSLIAKFTQLYKQAKAQSSILDFSDLEHETIRLLLGDDGVLTDVAKAMQEQYEEIMIDEYQDTNSVQETIFSALSNGHNRFMVGDVKQSIYRFRLAEPEIFMQHFDSSDADYAHADAGVPRKICLTQNFRSRPEILAATNDVMSACMSRQMGDVDYTESEALRAGRVDFTVPETNPVELVTINMDGMSDGTDDSKEAVAKADVEAQYVAKRISAMLKNETIQDEETGELRKVRASDIAIIMRSTKNAAKYYMKALADVGIASTAARNGSIMDTTEVATLYAYLQIIDNPAQDIPLVAVLASPLVGMTANELADIRVAQKDAASFYEALCVYAEKTGSEKASGFLSDLSALRSMVSNHKLSRVFDEILLHTDAEDVFGSMQNGDQRMANIQKFEELVAAFEAGGTRGLFEFLCHIESLRDQGAELPQASVKTADDAVQILSVHASKGLEYPIVFLCDLSRRFNASDLQQSVLLHKRLGAGVQIVDKELMYRFPSIARTAITAAMNQETKSEELRILYVAMTRAKQRLIMTYCDKMERMVTKLAAEATYPVQPHTALSVVNPGCWVLLTALTHEDANQLQAYGSSVPAEVRSTPSVWQLTTVNASDVVADRSTMEELESVAGEDVDYSACLCDEPYTAPDYEKLSEDLSFAYSHPASISTPSKVAVTQLCKPTTVQIRRPDFAKKDTEFTAAERGTATHLFMAYADYGKCVDLGMSGIRDEIAKLIVKKHISEHDAKAIAVKQLEQLFKSPVGKELAALPPQTTRREFAFDVLLPGSEILESGATDEKILLQGIVDLHTITDDGVIIYDFKTDFIAEGETAAEKAETYRPQLDLYAKALSEIYHKPICGKNMVFLRTGEKAAV